MVKRCARKGFTLAELLITLIVTGILLAALSTLAYAVSSATSADSNIAVTQAQLRQGTLRLQELIRDCRLVCSMTADDLAIWETDDNDDGAINVNELVYVERVNASGDEILQLCTFASAANPNVTFTAGSLSMTKSQLISNYSETHIPLIPRGYNIQFTLDLSPPSTRQVTVSFDIAQDTAVNHYEVHTTLRAWAGHLLNNAQDALVSDDDE